MRIRFILNMVALLGMAFFAISAAHAQIVYVDIDNISGNETGTSWTTAYTDIQTAINSAQPQAEIWVADGIYTHVMGLAVVTINNEFHLYGGFNGTETARDERNPKINLTAIDGGFGFPCVKINAPCTLDGFHLNNGYGSAENGAGVAVTVSGVTIANCTFFNNETMTNGGALYIEYADCTVQNCFFNNNRAANGAAICHSNAVKGFGATLTAINCVFVDNIASNSGIIFNEYVFTDFLHCTFYNNQALSGSLFQFLFEGQLTLTNSIITDHPMPLLSTGHSAVITVNYSRTGESFAGTGNTQADPLLVDPWIGNFNLAWDSPCKDVAPVDPRALTDIAGRDRPQGDLADMGAYELIQIGISTIEELQLIGTDPGYPLNGSYYLTQAIDASDTINWNGGMGFEPIGYVYSPAKTGDMEFVGTFDGQGYGISNLYIDRLDGSAVGLFSVIAFGASIEGLILENAIINGSGPTGGIAGLADASSIVDCVVNAQISGADSVGGIVGDMTGGTITRCSSSGTVNGEYTVGGIAGNNSSTITECFSNADVSALYGEAGGLVGYNYGAIENSFAVGDVSTDSTAGGLVGTNESTITNCHAAGYIFAYSGSGGLVGSSDAGTATASYWDVDITGQPTSAGGTGLSTAEMMQQITFTNAGWDFGTTWGMIEGTTYPYLQWSPLIPPAPIAIDTIEELQLIGNDPDYPLDGSYYLTQDIDASDTINWNSGQGFNPIGMLPQKAETGYDEFTGYFDGQGHSINDLYINRPDFMGRGLFGALAYGATVEQLTLNSASITGSSSVGGIAGIVNDAVITDCSVNGQIVGNNSVGGLVGSLSTGSINKCSTSGTVSGDGSIGGLVGYNNATITESFSTADVTALSSEAGGAVGYNTGPLTNCFSTGPVFADYNSGGLVGTNDGIVTNCYAAGPVSANLTPGGLVAYTYSGTVTASYWDVDTSGVAVSAGGTGLPTAQMMQMATFAGDGWDFETLWGIVEGVAYPHLLWSLPDPCDPDMTPPVITLQGDDPTTVECGSTYTDAGALATDDCDGDLTASVVVAGDTVNTAVVGAYVITYNVYDMAVNAAAEVTRTVNVLDSTAPLILLLGSNPVSVECGTIYTDAGATASDTCGGDLSSFIVVGGDVVNTAVPGTYSITYNVSDAAANAATQATRTVNVVDTTAPALMLLGISPVTLECGTTYTDAGATASDTCGGNLTSSIVIAGDTVNTAVPGIYVITYNVSDAAANAATQMTRTVNVVDTTAPTLTLLGTSPVTVECGTTYSDVGATASDTCGGDLTGSIVVGGDTVNTAVAGNYVITYNVSDTASNAAAQVTRTVRVQDSTPPDISLLGDNPMYLYVGDTFTEPGYTASDLCDPSVSTGVIVGGDTVDTSTVGAYAVTYSAEDASGNSAMVTRTVTVQEIPVPIAIDSIAALQLIGNDPGYPLNGSYYLTGDLDASDTINWNGGLGFQPIGNTSVATKAATEAFSGTFDGQNNTISGLGINRPGETNVGMFGLTSETAVISNLRFIDCNINGDWRVGALVGYNQGGTVINCLIHGHVVGESAVGIVVGEHNGSMAHSSATGSSECRNYTAGGLVGLNYGIITACYSEADVFSVNEAGGLVGANYGNIFSCFATGPATATTAYAGGLVAYNGMNINMCYAAGVVSAPTNAGGLVGYDDGGGVVQMSFWDMNTSGMATSAGGEGHSTAEMTQQATFTAQLWDFENMWGIIENESYPYLLWILEIGPTEGEGEPVEGEGEPVEGEGEPVEGEGEPVEGEGEPVEGEGEPVEGEGEPVEGEGEPIEGEGEPVEGEGEPVEGEGEPVDPCDPDATAPVVTLNGAASVTIECGLAFIDPGATAIDNCEGDVTNSIFTSSELDETVPGVYSYIYWARDSKGHTGSATRTITVLDNEAPLLRLYGRNVVEYQCNADYVELGAFAYDLCEGSLTDQVQISGMVDTAVPGLYSLLYTVTDSTGKSSSIVRNVYVLDTCITLPPAGDLETCLAACPEEGVDADGDGLTACQEACHGTSDEDVDSDYDGMSDGAEIKNGLEPLVNDSSDDVDGDNITNLDETLITSDPSNINDPRRVYFVDVNGSDELGDGTPEFPYQTIAHALQQASPATVADPAAVVVNQGSYVEGILDMPRYVSLESRLGAVVVIESQINGAEGSSISYIELRPPANAEYLFFAEGFGINITGVVFQGMAQPVTGIVAVPLGMGISFPGKVDFETVIDNCIFTGLDIGIDIYGDPPVLRRNIFRNIAYHALVVRAETKSLFSKSLGDADSPESGFNTFEDSTGGADVVNETNEEITIENNDWDTDNPDEVDDRIDGPADYQPILPKGTGMTAASLFCSVIQSTTTTPVLNATVTLGTLAVTRNQQGVYAFPAIASGTYTLTVTAPEYDSYAENISVNESALLSITTPIKLLGAEEGEPVEGEPVEGEQVEGEGEGEDEGEGEGKPEKRCGCRRDETESKSPSLPDSGNLLLSGIALIVLVAYPRNGRNNRI